MEDVIKFLTENPQQYLATTGLDGNAKVRPILFYFAEDGMDYEDEEGLNRYLKDHTRKEIIEQIADSIIDMQKDYANTITKEEKEELGEACPECFYYYLYIIDALSNGKEVILPIC